MIVYPKLHPNKSSSRSVENRCTTVYFLFRNRVGIALFLHKNTLKVFFVASRCFRIPYVTFVIPVVYLHSAYERKSHNFRLRILIKFKISNLILVLIIRFMHILRCTLFTVCANEFDRSIHGLNANIHAADNKVKIQFNDEIIHKVRETTKDFFHHACDSYLP